METKRLSAPYCSRPCPSLISHGITLSNPCSVNANTFARKWEFLHLSLDENAHAFFLPHIYEVQPHNQGQSLPVLYPVQLKSGWKVLGYGNIFPYNE